MPTCQTLYAINALGRPTTLHYLSMADKLWLMAVARFSIHDQINQISCWILLPVHQVASQTYGGFLGPPQIQVRRCGIQVIVVAMQVRPVEIQVNVVELHLSSVEIHVGIVEIQVSAY